MEALRVAFAVGDTQRVSGLLLDPPGARACLVLAHGAGTDMTHPSLAAVAEGLCERGISTFRYNFPFMEHGRRGPDQPLVAHQAVRAAVGQAAGLLPHLPLVAGGRSFGGRMTSQAQAASPLPGVQGLAFLAFPLHPAGSPSIDRAAHLQEVRIPMLFLQGTRDALADMGLLRALVADLSSRATLRMFDDADHAFHVPARSGRKNEEVGREMLDRLAEWIAAIAKA